MIINPLKFDFKMKIWWEYGYLATDLVPLPLTKNSEKNPGNSQKSALSGRVKFGESKV